MTKEKEKFIFALVMVPGIYAIAFFMSSCATPKKSLDVDECLKHYMFSESSAGIVRILDKGSDFYMVMNTKGTKYKFPPDYVESNYVEVSCEKVGL